jgi:hypothetical protein
MEQMIAYCGLSCRTCPIYLATREQDAKKKREMRAEIAQKINEIYKKKTKAEDVTDCDGCKTKERLFSGSNKCQIKACAKKKEIENCAYCSEYACEQLLKFFAMDPEAKRRLDQTRKDINNRGFNEQLQSGG